MNGKTTFRVLPLVGLILGLYSCGHEASPVESVHISLPWQGPSVTCTTSVLANMKVELLISGYEQEPCQLDIGGDLRVTGTCHGIQRGLTRYLLLSYRVANSDESALLDLAHMVSFVDLSKGAIGDATSRNVDLEDNGTTGKLLYQNSDIEGLPTSFDPSFDSQMDSAKGWARTILEQNNVTFDKDRDECPNLLEACVNTIFDQNHLSNCN